jgi:hypothetical protein
VLLSPVLPFANVKRAETPPITINASDLAKNIPDRALTFDETYCEKHA